jgi:hypothetical protein
MGMTLVNQYSARLDAKKRLTLRGIKTEFFQVKVFSDGQVMLEPRVLVPPSAVSKRTLKMLAGSVANLKKGRASAPVDLAQAARLAQNA